MSPIYTVISEEEFLPLTGNVLDPFCRILNFISKDSTNLSKKYYSNLLKCATDLETFLDDHGATSNLTWVFFRELTASIRNLSFAAFELKHTLDRFPDYGISETESAKAQFFKEAEATIAVFNRSILSLFHAIRQEAEKIGLKMNDRVMEDKEFHEVTGRIQLPKTIDLGNNRNNEERILELARKYRKVWKIFRDENLWEKREGDSLLELIPLKIDVKKAQKLKNTIHSVQSDFDTYVKNSPIEKSNPAVKKFRGYISILLHLMEVARWLLHFYERHGDEIKTGETNIRISRIIDKYLILERMNNFSLYYSGYFLQKGNKIAEEILSAYVKKVSYELPVPDPLGFHARPSTYISMIVNEHGTDVFLLVDGQRFNAKSVLTLMEAGGMIADMGIKKVTFEGDKRVLDDLKILAEYNYCEDKDIPRPLNYLRIIRNIKR